MVMIRDIVIHVINCTIPELVQCNSVPGARILHSDFPKFPNPQEVESPRIPPEFPNLKETRIGRQAKKSVESFVLLS